MTRAVGIVVLLGVWSLGCADVDAEIDALATDSVVATQNLETSPGETSQSIANKEDPFGDFGVQTNDVAAMERETPVWLVNESTQSLIVTARGGAESVVVDTVGASDSTFVRINSRALTLELSARTFEGIPMGTVALPMDSKNGRAAFPR